MPVVRNHDRRFSDVKGFASLEDTVRGVHMASLPNRIVPVQFVTGPTDDLEEYVQVRILDTSQVVWAPGDDGSSQDGAKALVERNNNIVLLKCKHVDRMERGYSEDATGNSTQIELGQVQHLEVQNEDPKYSGVYGLEHFQTRYRFKVPNGVVVDFAGESSQHHPEFIRVLVHSTNLNSHRRQFDGEFVHLWINRKHLLPQGSGPAGGAVPAVAYVVDSPAVIYAGDSQAPAVAHAANSEALPVLTAVHGSVPAVAHAADFPAVIHAANYQVPHVPIAAQNSEARFDLVQCYATFEDTTKGIFKSSIAKHLVQVANEGATGNSTLIEFAQVQHLAVRNEDPKYSDVFGFENLQVRGSSFKVPNGVVVDFAEESAQQHPDFIRVIVNVTNLNSHRGQFDGKFVRLWINRKHLLPQGSGPAGGAVPAGAYVADSPAVIHGADSQAPAVAHAANSQVPPVPLAVLHSADFQAPAVAHAANSEALLVPTAVHGSVPAVAHASDYPAVIHAVDSKAPAVAHAANSQAAPVPTAAVHGPAPAVAYADSPAVIHAADSQAPAVAHAAKSQVAPVPEAAVRGSVSAVAYAADSPAVIHAADSQAPAVAHAANSQAARVPTAAVHGSVPAVAYADFPAVIHAADSQAPAVAHAANSQVPPVPLAVLHSADFQAPAVAHAANSKAAPVPEAAVRGSVPAVAYAADSPAVIHAADSQAPAVAHAANSQAAPVPTAAVYGSVPEVACAADFPAVIHAVDYQAAAVAHAANSTSEVPPVPTAAHGSVPAVAYAADSLAVIHAADSHAPAVAHAANSQAAPVPAAAVYGSVPEVACAADSPAVLHAADSQVPHVPTAAHGSVAAVADAADSPPLRAPTAAPEWKKKIRRAHSPAPAPVCPECSPNTSLGGSISSIANSGEERARSKDLAAKGPVDLVLWRLKNGATKVKVVTAMNAATAAFTHNVRPFGDKGPWNFVKELERQHFPGLVDAICCDEAGLKNMEKLRGHHKTTGEPLEIQLKAFHVIGLAEQQHMFPDIPHEILWSGRLDFGLSSGGRSPATPQRAPATPQRPPRTVVFESPEKFIPWGERIPVKNTFVDVGSLPEMFTQAARPVQTWPH